MIEPRTLKVAIVSANWGVTSHLPAWRVLPEVEVVGICTAREATARAAAAANGIDRAYWSIADVCADPDIDIVDCGTRPDVREDLVEAVLRAGKHCYSGVPFTTNGERARRLRDLQHEAGVRTMIDTPIVRVPALVRMRELIDEGFVGEIWQVNAQWNMQFMLRPPAEWPYRWFAEAGSGASALRNLGSHVLNAAVSLVGPIAETIAQGEIFLKQWRYADGATATPRNIDTATTLLRFTNGAIGSFAASWVAADGPGFSLEIFGSKGRLRVEAPSYPDAQTTRLYGGPAGTAHAPAGEWLDVPARLFDLPGSLLDPTLADTQAARERVRGPQDLVNALMYRELVQAIRDGRDATPDFAQGCHVQQAIEAADRSIASRRWETVRP